jgi:hypothetical protein
VVQVRAHPQSGKEHLCAVVSTGDDGVPLDVRALVSALEVWRHARTRTRERERCRYRESIVFFRK